MGLLTKIIGTDPGSSSATAAPPGAVAAQPLLQTTPSTAPPTPTWPTPLPCPTCSSAIFYRDVYGGGPHCRGCQPVSSPSLVRDFLWVLWSVADSKWYWSKNPREEFPQGGGDFSGDPSAGADGNTLADHDATTPPPLRTIRIDDRDGRTGRTWLVTAADVTPAEALRGRLDLLRVAGTGGTGDGLGEGRYSPPRGCGPVGDLVGDEWFESLPKGLVSWGRR